jgi:hypothetical protein
VKKLVKTPNKSTRQPDSDRRSLRDSRRRSLRLCRPPCGKAQPCRAALTSPRLPAAAPPAQWEGSADVKKSERPPNVPNSISEPSFQILDFKFQIPVAGRPSAVFHTFSSFSQSALPSLPRLPRRCYRLQRAANLTSPHTAWGRMGLEFPSLKHGGRSARRYFDRAPSTSPSLKFISLLKR